MPKTPQQLEFDRRLCIAVEAARSLGDAQGCEVTLDDIEQIRNRIEQELSPCTPIFTSPMTTCPICGGPWPGQ